MTKIIMIIAIIFIALLAFSMLSFGVNEEFIEQSYNTSRKYATDAKTLSVSIQTYKDIIEQQVKYVESITDPAGEYFFPVEPVNYSSLYISLDFKEWSTNDAYYGSAATAHKGIDIHRDNQSASNGDCYIRAACSGTIIQFGYNEGNGNYICIEDSFKNQWFYLHMEKIDDELMARLNKEDVTVKAGDRLGIMGDTGKSAGRHLHFQLNKKDGTSFTVNNPFTMGVFDCSGLTTLSQYEQYKNRATTSDSFTYALFNNFTNLTTYMYGTGMGSSNNFKYSYEEKEVTLGSTPSWYTDTNEKVVSIDETGKVVLQ